MRNLYLVVLILQLILSGCSPDGGFSVRQSVSEVVAPTDKTLNGKKRIVIKPLPNKDNQNPSEHIIGPLKLTEGKMVRREDQSFLFTAKLTMLDDDNSARWSKDIELEGSLITKSMAELYPVHINTSELPIRARVTCLDHRTCRDSVVDVFVREDNLTYGAQVRVIMPIEKPKITPKERSPKTGKKAEDKSTVQDSKPAKPFKYPERPHTKTPQNNKSANGPTSPVKKTPTTTAKKEFQYPQRPHTPTPGAKTAGKTSSSAKVEIPKQPKSPAEDKLDIQVPVQDSAKTPKSAPDLAKVEDQEKCGFWKRLFKGCKTEILEPEAMDSGRPQESAAQRISKKAAAQETEKKQRESSKPTQVMTEAPTALQAPEKMEKSSGVNTPTQDTVVKRPPARPTLPKAPTAEKTPQAPPMATASPAAKGNDKSDELIHEEELEEDEHVHEEEEEPSLFIGTLHEPTEDLFSRDRALTTSERPEPRPENPEDDLGDDVSAANNGSRPKDQVIGQTSCWSKKRARGTSCGFLERPTDLTTVNKEFNMFNLGRKRHYGSFELVTVIKYLGEYYKSSSIFGDMNVNDLSQKSGGHLRNSAHVSHQNGLDADISYPVGPKGKAFTKYITDSGSATSSFKARETWAIFKAAWTTDLVDRIFVSQGIKTALCKEARRAGDAEEYKELLRRIRPEPGHGSHYHLRIKCTPAQPRCQTMGPPAAGSGC